MAITAVIIITRGVVAVIIAVGMAAAVVMAPGKDSEKKPQKILPAEKKGTPLEAPNAKGSINRDNKCIP